MTIAFQHMGPFNGTMPVPTGMLISYMHDLNKTPHLRYAQIVPAPDTVFSYNVADPDHNIRLVGLNENDWADGADRPSGSSFGMRVKGAESRIERRDFGWTLGDETIRQWTQKGKLDIRNLFDKAQANRARLHRSSRIVSLLQSTTWTNATGTIQSVLGLANPAYISDASGQEYIGGNKNPFFMLIKKVFQKIKRIIHLQTNGALDGEELVCVMPPIVAAEFSTVGEIVEVYKQSSFAEKITTPNLRDWSIPETYGGFALVVEDTPRVYIVEKADGTVADVSVPAEKDYILNEDTMYFVSRPGGLNSQGLGTNFSTVQVWTWNGGEYVEGFTDARNKRVENHIVTEDRVLVPAVASGYRLTDVLPG